ncbi:DNA polymerase III subunit gamma/tau [Lucifera butyrica]|uniref:DNA polymerase III subunit gamma/tau n=1 Tax=Lucifera butyrica TaxID=1351585 RepID=UPI001FB32CA0|nr:DNA polymerase III subunit gamma/tau [Lucifera butyrica]
MALYRAWRPQDFDNLIGQEHISITLKNAITSGKIAHAYLFSGPRGTGKTSTAKILAKALNCVDGPTDNPCNHCPSCEKVTAGTSMDVLEIDAASNRGIDEIRDLRETVKFAPVDGRYKVYIIDEVHMLTTEAFNALLKTLEEPPAHVVFILATTEPHKIPATIHSRCQRYDFHRIAVKEIQSRLTAVADSEKIEFEPEALLLIASQADGGMRDALSILDQCAMMSENKVTVANARNLLGLIGHEWIWKMVESLASRDAGAVLNGIDEMISLGKDVRQILVELVLYGRSLLLYKAAPDFGGTDLYGADQERLASQSRCFTQEELSRMLQTLNEAINEAKWSGEPRIIVEMALLTICRRQNTEDVERLAERVEALEAKLAGMDLNTVMAGPAPHTPVRAKMELPDIRTQQKMASGLASQEQTGKPVELPAADQESMPVSTPDDLKNLWQGVLKELQEGGKRAVHACVVQGQLVSLDNDQAVIHFSSPFPKERTEKEDYRTIIEKLIAQVCGRHVRLQCVLTAGTSPAKATTTSRPPAEEEHPVLKKALAVFGGKVMKQEENKGES